jgi:hypothetical protein
MVLFRLDIPGYDISPSIMYARVSRKKDKTYQYLKPCEAYRSTEGQPRTLVLMTLGRLNQLDRRKIDAAMVALLVYRTNCKILRATDPVP